MMTDRHSIIIIIGISKNSRCYHGYPLKFLNDKSIIKLVFILYILLKLAILVSMHLKQSYE